MTVRESAGAILLMVSLAACSNESKVERTEPEPLRVATFPTKSEADINASGSQRIQGELASVNGCVVLKGSPNALVAFDPDYVSVVDQVVVLKTRDADGSDLRLAMGDELDAGGGSLNYDDAVKAGFQIPPSCEEFQEQQIAVIERW